MVQLNPYQPSSVSLRRSAVGVVAEEHPAGIAIELTGSRTLVRRFQLSGRFEAEVEWNASGCFEFIRVNGDKVCSRFASLRSIPRFQFELRSANGRQTMAGVIDVSVRWAFVTEAFRFCLNGFPIYREGVEGRLAEKPRAAAIDFDRKLAVRSSDDGVRWWRDKHAASEPAGGWHPGAANRRPRRPR